MRKTPITVGDRVRYSRAFLQSTMQYAGAVPHARGTVIAVAIEDKKFRLVTVEWDNVSASNVLACNLTPESRVHLEPV